MKYIFYYSAFFEKGGVPEDCSSLAQALLSIGDEVLVVADVTKRPEEHPIDKQFTLRHEEFIKGLKEQKFHDFIVVLVGFSSITNIKIIPKIKKASLKICLLPINQINRYLDLDNPFETNELPIVDNEGKVNVSLKVGRSVRGEVNYKAKIQQIKRIIYRKTLGLYLVKNSDYIGIFSEYEKSEFVSEYSGYAEKLFYYTLGTSTTGRIKGNDAVEDDRIKVIMWSRVDVYYKGILEVAKMVAQLSNSARRKYLFLVAGPDYKGGKRKLQDKVLELGISNSFKILNADDYTPGCLSLLENSDFILSYPKWDGYPRALREAMALAVPILANKESNFDIPLNKYLNGKVLSNQSDFVDCFENMTIEDCKAFKYAALKAVPCASWNVCARAFSDKIIQ